MKRRFFFTIFIFFGLFSIYAETYGQLQNRILLIIEEADALWDQLPDRLDSREDWKNYGRYWAACEWLVENMDAVYIQLSGLWESGYKNSWRRTANFYKGQADKLSEHYRRLLEGAQLEEEEDRQLYLNDREAWEEEYKQLEEALRNGDEYEPEHDASFASTNMNFGHEITQLTLLAGGSRLK